MKSHEITTFVAEKQPIFLGETSRQVKSYLAAGQEVGLWHRQDGVFPLEKHHGMVGLW